MKIILVENEIRHAHSIRYCLEEESYTVVWASCCSEANECLFESEYDLIILDIDQNKCDGMDLIIEWRSSQLNEPILVLSSENSSRNIIKALNRGADAYMTKPFSHEELLARVRALLRRNKKSTSAILTYKNLSLNLLSRSCSIGRNEIELTKREFAFLELFLQNKERVLTRTQIAEKIWHNSYDIDTNLIDVYVRKIRQKLKIHSEDKWLKTIRGTGYCLK